MSGSKTGSGTAPVILNDSSETFTSITVTISNGNIISQTALSTDDIVKFDGIMFVADYPTS